MNQLMIKKKNELTTNKKKGFTLVELIIVIAIIAILAAMAIPKFSAVRLDAKVSNDVAAAKNIATIVSTLVANGDITVPTTDDIDVSANTDIQGRLDGKASDGLAEALAEGKFMVNIDTKENITVYVDEEENQLYPDNDGTGKADYVDAVNAQE